MIPGEILVDSGDIELNRDRDAVTLVVTKLTDANTVEVAHRVRAAMAAMEKTLPDGMRFVIELKNEPA